MSTVIHHRKILQWDSQRLSLGAQAVVKRLHRRVSFGAVEKTVITDYVTIVDLADETNNILND